MAQASVKRPDKEVTLRKLRAAIRVGLADAVTVWHGQMLPGHFTTGAVGKYGYEPRTARYMRRKARRMRHQRPLVYTGDSEAAARSDFTISTATIAGHLAGVVTMQMPSYFVQHPTGGSTFIDKPAEMTRTTAQEREALGHVFAEGVRRTLGFGSAMTAASA